VRESSRNALPTPWRDRSIPLVLAALSFAAALLQRPGQAVSDTKIDLHVDPVGFLGDVASVWTNTGSLGEVQGGQYAGYIFPMGPFFALGDLLGLAPWLVHRLWLGLLLALAAWGTVRLLDALLSSRRGVAHAVAGLLFAINPYTVIYAQRTSVTLLGLAVLPWLLLAAHRGLGEPRRWLWPAALALLVASSGAAVNAAVTAWVLVAPVLLVLYERLIGNVAWSDVRAFAWRAGLLTGLASAWWVAPVLLQALYGIDFLQFTEQPGAIWSTTSITESLRLMGYWPSYLGVGFGALEPFYESSPTLLYEPVVVVATLLVPALSLAGFAAARRWTFGPFFLALTLLGLTVMAAGFPPGTPLRHGLTFTYNHLEAVQFLRTTHKAGPLVALGLACLGGFGAAAVARAVPRRAAAALAVAGLVLLAASVWPLARGEAIDSRLTWDEIPPAWKQAARGLDRRLPPSSRAMVLPGQLFASYEWGATGDPILPVLTDRPVALRQFVPRADLHGVDLLWGIDSLVQQQRLLPGQLRPLLGLLGVGAVVTGADDVVRRSGAVPPRVAARALAAQGLREPAATYGRTGDLPRVRRYDLAPVRSLVRVQPAARPLVVDGSAAALTGLAAFGALPSHRTIEYAADRGGREIRAAVRRGADVVISDSNRRRVYVTARLRQSAGPTLAAGEEISEDAAVLDPFPDRGDGARTLAVYEGVSHLRAPYSPGFPQFPESRPMAALDGDPATEWLADHHLDVDRRWVEVGFERRRDVPAIDLLPAGGRRTAVIAVSVDGRSFPVEPGWNRIRLGLRDVDRLRLRIGSEPAREDLSDGNGVAELRIPGVRARELLRPPTLVESALRGRDLSRSAIAYLFERTTSDRPFKRDDASRPVRTTPPRDHEDPEAERIRHARDPEREIARVIRPPARRTYALDAWVSLAPDASGDAIEAMRAGCDAAAVSFERAGRVGLRVSGPARALKAGRPVRARGCRHVSLPAGVQRVETRGGPLRVHLLRMRSAAPAGAPRPVRTSGAVLDSGHEARGRYENVRVRIDAPSWLVLGESYNRGWRARCDGRDLGEPEVVDGYANGWRPPGDCRDVELAFAPQRAVTAGYAVSAVSCLGLLFLLPAGGVRRRRSGPVVATVPAREAARPRRWPAGRAAIAAAVAAAAIGFVFALRAGVVLGPLVGLVLWRGIGARTLVTAAVALLAFVVPLVYVLAPAEDGGGYNSGYARDLIGAHWVGVAAFVLLALALWRSLSTARGRRDDPAPARADADVSPARP
jgi:arabinofuranan 3-O-arabinosyltransferase